MRAEFSQMQLVGMEDPLGSCLPLVSWEDAQESILFEGERDASPDTESLASRNGCHNFLLFMNYLA